MDEVQKWFLEHASDESLDQSWENMVSGMGSDDYALSSEGFKEFRKRIARENPWWKRALRVTERVAAILLVPLVVTTALLLFKKPSHVQWNEVYTHSGETCPITLPDGSSITLSPESHILYPSSFSKDHREIYMQGEVYADIVHMEKCPFEIHADDITVKVLGTEFNFSSYSSDAECELALVNGAVEMNIEGAESTRHSVSLKTGEMVRYTRENGSIEKLRFSPESYLANAKRGGLQFSNRKMEDIARCLERRFGEKIVIEDQSIAQERFFASFINGEDLPTILDALNVQDNVKIEKKGKTYFLSLN